MTADWYLMRASGVVALLLPTVVMALGIATSNRFRPRGLPLFVTTTVHRNASLLAVAFLAVHVLTAVVDPDASVSLLSAAVPLTAGWRPLPVGLGALALDLVAALVVTTLLRRRLGYRTWRAIHWSAYAAWPLAVVHGLTTGTDTGSEWLAAVNGVCAALVAGAAVWRAFGLEAAGARQT